MSGVMRPRSATRDGEGTPGASGAASDARAVTPTRHLPDESEALRELARHLANVADTPTLLRILLEAVHSQ